MPSSTFDSMARVLTDDHGNVTRIVEVKDATDKEKTVRRMNLGTYAVNNEWLWQALHNVQPSPVTNEYYLTEIIRMAFEEGKKVTALTINSEREALGINTREHLAEAENVTS